MYGTIRKSYGDKYASIENENESKSKTFKKEKKLRKKRIEAQPTSYVNLNEIQEKENTQENFGRFSSNKNEFPVASVILTIVFTMLAMVFVFGFGV